MAILDALTSAAKRLGQQYRAFSLVRRKRGFRARSGLDLPAIQHPNWQLILVVMASLVALGFLFFDEAAGHWRSTISGETYHFFRAYTDFAKSEVILVPAGITVLALGLLPWHRLDKASVAVVTRFQMFGLYAFVAVAGSGISNNLIKMMIGRARPRYFDQLGPHHFDPPGFSSGFQSFPSGHSATAGAMAIIFILLFPRLKWIWLGVAFWIGVSRIVVGAHYPSDTVAGLTYGASFAWLLALWCANRRLLFRSEAGLIRIPKTSALSLGKLYKALHMMRQKA
ncbi:undecaprenyl-diphosphatase [Cohaesibacter sp. ES.047]|uniref:phosphatase PAP2 family protein n=1 Tax=Cohaesibacter sp. ES.047 TaxID=1798205 RepID=UPI000BB6C09D|nr:phosphatase PAP2 family protein [Cohaesibacter sp. ES.047]SNY93482.1 undecaprenyl-diphosphatase [Cohaesibacter sp. ES.047]